jgi:hypothetical protein
MDCLVSVEESTHSKENKLNTGGMNYGISIRFDRFKRY